MVLDVVEIIVVSDLVLELSESLLLGASGFRRERRVITEWILLHRYSQRGEDSTIVSRLSWQITFDMKEESGRSRIDPSIALRKRSNPTRPVRFDFRCRGHYSKRLSGRTEVSRKPG